MTTQYLGDDIERDEGLRLKPYKDTEGNWTIGVGHELAADPALNNLLAHLMQTGISMDQALQLRDRDINQAKTELNLHLPWWRQLSDPRQDVFVNLVFNMGISKFLGFHRMLGFAETRDYGHAADELQASDWFNEVGDRGPRLVAQLRTGIRA